MWRRLAVAMILVLGAVRSALQQQHLPYCGPHTDSDNDLVIVSTLDGMLTALSAASGDKVWDLQTEPLLSSNLHHVELTSGGKWVRLVPSLSGALYRLSGDSLEPLPLTAEQLLSSSFKYSDELVVAGARATSWLGVEARSGRVVYRCGTAGCAGDDDPASARAAVDTSGASDLLVLKHSAHTVRALDPRTGHEKWNFSVAEHQLSGGDYSACAIEQEDVSVSLVLPDGVVSVTKDSRLVWKHQLSAPVADAWTLTRGRLQRLDVLTAAGDVPASLYIGLHDQQIYIQEGVSYTSSAASAALVPLAWRPRSARPLLSAPDPHSNTALQQVSEADTAALALLSLYDKTAHSLGNHGYFLTAPDPSTCKHDSGQLQVQPAPSDDSHTYSHHHVHLHVYSLWFWWKEVVLIAVSSALLMNLMIWPRLFVPRFRVWQPLDERASAQAAAPCGVPPAAGYASRYASDFTPLRCLGRGGFGVVFECRNNIDHCSYAVKRITLPRREWKRERVLREVRALAKLEHENIVRYFNAWVEEPPPAWQKQQDLAWLRDLEGVSLSMTEDHALKERPRATDTTRTSRTQDGDAVVLDLHKQHRDKADESTRRNRSFSCDDSLSIALSERTQQDARSEDDSFIVFAHSHELNNNPEAGDATSVNKHLETVKVCDDELSKSATSGKKKKGHRRHWSLDLCVRSSVDVTSVAGSEMYLYIQMQLCRRDSLHAWLRHNRSQATRRDQVPSLFGQIVAAVEYVHLAGLIHRDLKPGNIFFAPDGRVKIGDFGLVTAMGDSSSGDEASGFDPQARRTYRVGTHLYMSPEQLRGEPYDFTVDIYSLGLILFELLQPFSTESERVACLLRLRDGHFPDTFSDRLPHECRLLERMLSARPSLRPTAGAVRGSPPLCQLHTLAPPPLV